MATSLLNSAFMAVDESHTSPPDRPPDEKSILTSGPGPTQDMASGFSPNIDDPKPITTQCADKDIDSEHKSNVVTLEPFLASHEQSTAKNENSTKVNRPFNRRQKYRPEPTLIHFDHLFGSGNWSRFLTLKTDTPVTSTKLENFLLTKCASRDMSLRQVDDLNWLIEATSKIQSETYQEITSMENINIVVGKHDQLNSIYGTVVLPQQIEETDKNLLLDSLKKRYSNVEKLEIYEIPQRGKPNTKLTVAKIKFEGQHLPTDIRIMGQKREVRPHIPKPLQCKKCSKFGHSINNCRNEPACAFCSSSEHATRWNCGISKCINCGQNHHARSKECTFYIYNTEIKLLMDRTGMKIREAKLELQARGIRDPARNPQFRAVVKNLTPQNANHSNDTKTATENKIPNTENDNLISVDERNNNVEHIKGTKRMRENNSPPKIAPPNVRTLKSIADLRKSCFKNASISDQDDVTEIDMTPSLVFQSTRKPKDNQSKQENSEIQELDHGETTQNWTNNIFDGHRLNIYTGTTLERCSSRTSLDELFFDAPLDQQSLNNDIREQCVIADVHVSDINTSKPLVETNMNISDKKIGQLISEEENHTGTIKKTNKCGPRVNRGFWKV